MNLDDAPRGPGGGRYDGGVAPGQLVEQARLAGVGGADDGNQDSVAHSLAPAVVLEVGRDRLFQAGDFVARPRVNAHGQVFVRKIQADLAVGQGPKQTSAPILVNPAQFAFELAQGLFALGRGFGLDQIGQPFGGGEVHFAVLERAPGEFPRLGHPQAGHAAERIKHAPNDGGAAMKVKLGHILAGKAGGRGKPDHQAVVDGLAGCGIADAGAHGPPGRQ